MIRASLFCLVVSAFACAACGGSIEPPEQVVDADAGADGSDVPYWCQPTIYAIPQSLHPCAPQGSAWCTASEVEVTLSCSIRQPVGVIVGSGPDPEAGIVGDFRWCCSPPAVDQ
jgi:hypothetical protein